MRRRTGLIVAQTLLGVALLVVWAWIVDLGAVGETLGQANWGFVLLAAVLGVTSSVVRAMRWRLILRPVAHIPRLDVWLISLASSLINFVIPIHSGELARGLFLKQKHGVPISASLPTVAVDRSTDLLAVLVVGAFGAVSGLTMEGPLSLVLLLGAGLFIVFFAFVLLAIFSQDRLMPLVERLVPRSFGKRFRDRLLSILNGLLVGFAAIGRRPRSLIPIIALSFGATLLDATLFYMLFLSVGAVISPLVVLTGYALFVITFIVPGAPGYIGSMEAFGSLVFGALGVGAAVAASVIVLFHALNAIILALAGGMAMWALGFRPSTAFHTVVEALSSAQHSSCIDADSVAAKLQQIDPAYLCVSARGLLICGQLPSRDGPRGIIRSPAPAGFLFRDLDP